MAPRRLRISPSQVSESESKSKDMASKECVLAGGMSEMWPHQDEKEINVMQRNVSGEIEQRKELQEP